MYWRGVLQGFVALQWLRFQALHQMKPQSENNDGFGLGRLGRISFSFHAHGKEGLRQVSDECWMVHQDS